LASTWWVARHELQKVDLIDGTVAIFNSGATLAPALGYPNPRAIDIDGEFWLQATGGGAPLTVRSRLLVLRIEGKSALHIVALSSETGAQVEVLYGDVTANKNYPSNYSEPDHLGAGEMSMVNRTIDLMEKEKLNLDEIRALKDKLR
jgi:hypothetical protein